MTWLPNNFTSACINQPPLKICQPGSFLAFLTILVQYLGFSYDELYAKPESDETLTQSYDFIIVGAGSAGCVVANRLSEIYKWKILLVEAGEEEPLIANVPGLSPAFLIQSNIDYGYSTEPEPVGNTVEEKTKYYYPRGKVMGGSSTINAMIYNRGNKQDYDDWAELGNKGWSWNEVLPYFKKSEDARDPRVLSKNPESHGTGGYLKVERFPVEDLNSPAILKAWEELGLYEIDYNNGSQIGAARMQFTTLHGSRQSSNGAFIRPIRGKRSNLVIKPNSMVKRILIDRKTKRAIGVEYINGKNVTVTAYASKEVIISAGAIESPKLLMLSGIGPAADLKKFGIEVIQDLPVGRNLQDHFYLTPVSINLTRTRKFSASSLQNDVVEWLNTHEGPLSGLGVSDTLAYYQTSFENRVNVPDVQYFFYGLLSQQSNDSLDFGTRVPLVYYDTAILGTIAVAPKSRGYVKLNSKDPLKGQPEIQLNYLDDPLDVKVMTEGIRFAIKFANTKTLKRLRYAASSTIVNTGCENYVSESDDYYECVVRKRIQTCYHAVGTCKMGPVEDKSTVVSSDLKVHGIEGLRVIDASIMPVIPRANTNAPTIMIAEKGSDLIKKDWRM